LFAPVNRFDRIPELAAPSRLDLDERDRPLSLYNQIDVAVPAPEPALNDTPSLLPKPTLRYALTQLAEFLPGR
jgi:hypothetical protein